MGRLTQTDSSNAALTVLEDGLYNPVTGFSFRAGVFAPSHTYNGFAVAGYNGPAPNSVQPAYGALIAGNVHGLAIDSINTDTSPFSGTAVALHGALGTETWSMTVQTDTVPFTFTSAGQKHTYTNPGVGGVAWEFFFATPPVWTPGKVYTFTVV
jgi:hypothetical protein